MSALTKPRIRSSRKREGQAANADSRNPQSNCGLREIDVAPPGKLAENLTPFRARAIGPVDAPVVLVLGGISASPDVVTDDGCETWWKGVVGHDCAIDPDRVRVVGVEFAADPRGRFAPSTSDQAACLCAALDALGITRADLVLGASYGGMVALALAAEHPERVAQVVAISAPASPHPFATAQRELQRRVVSLGLESGRGAEALSIARGLGMTCYRTAEEFGARFAGGIEGSDTADTSTAGAYLRARGDGFETVMSPERFLSLSASIDRHHVDPRAIRLPVTVIGAAEDRLVPLEQLEDLAAALPDARFHVISSLYGHDAFLKETRAIASAIAPLVAAL